MSTALDRAVNTVELLELILLALPLDELLRARRISRTCRDLIERSKFLNQIRNEAYVAVNIQLPTKCSSMQEDAPKLEAEFVLYHHQPLTLCTNLRCIEYPSKFFYKYKADRPPFSQNEFRQHIWGGGYCAATQRFVRYRAYRWTTFYPGVPQRLTWDFRRHRKAMSRSFDGDMGFTEVGTDYILRLRPNLRIGHLVGVRKSLIERKEDGDDLKDCVLNKHVMLVGENEARFSVVP